MALGLLDEDEAVELLLWTAEVQAPTPAQIEASVQSIFVDVQLIDLHFYSPSPKTDIDVEQTPGRADDLETRRLPTFVRHF